MPVDYIPLSFRATTFSEPQTLVRADERVSATPLFHSAQGPRLYRVNAAVCLWLTLGYAATARAGWVAINLHPPSAEASNLNTTTGMGHQAGSATFQVLGSPVRQAVVWSGTPGSWVSLHPSGATDSFVLKSDGIHQGGSVQFGGPSHAAVWSLTPQSFVDLNPSGATESAVWAVVRACKQIR